MLTENDDDISIAALRELAEKKRQELIEARRRGGRYKASYSQKIKARQTIAETKPWQKSTGAKTEQGKKRVSQNNRYFHKAHYSAPSEPELNAIADAIRPPLQRFQKEMRDRKLGAVKIIMERTTTGHHRFQGNPAKLSFNAIAELRATGQLDIVFKCELTVKVRVSKYKIEDEAAIAALFKRCTEIDVLNSLMATES